MDPAAYLPGMRRGRRVRNLAVGAVYLISLPLVVFGVVSFACYVVITSRFGRPDVGRGGRTAGSGTSLHPMITQMIVVGLTVLAAAGVAALATGFVSMPMADVPQASFSFDGTTPGTVEITHVAGDRLDAATITVRLDDDPAGGSWQSDTVSTGSTYRVTGVEPGETIRVIYTGSDGRSVPLATHEVR